MLPVACAPAYRTRARTGHRSLPAFVSPSTSSVSQFKQMLIEDFEQMKRKDADKEGKLKIVGKTR